MDEYIGDVDRCNDHAAQCMTCIDRPAQTPPEGNVDAARERIGLPPDVRTVSNENPTVLDSVLQ